MQFRQRIFIENLTPSTLDVTCFTFLLGARNESSDFLLLVVGFLLFLRLETTIISLLASVSHVPFTSPLEVPYGMQAASWIFVKFQMDTQIL